MTGSVESAKDVAKDIAKEGESKAETAKSSPEDLLKQAVAGKVDAKPAATPAAAAAPARRMPSLRLDARFAAVATAALVVGTAFGMVSAPRERSGEALARIEAGLQAGRTEADRLGSEIERLTKTVASLRESADGARGDVKALGASLTERITRMEQGFDKKIAALGERIAHPDREAAAAPAPQPEKRAAIPVAALPTTSAAVAASTPKAEPTQTASITDAKAETKPKTETVESWALRDVYDGVAMLEDRKRRLLEVAPGESIPGIGRVESIERRGRIWVVVTKQGLITPQTW